MRIVCLVAVLACATPARGDRCFTTDADASWNETGNNAYWSNEALPAAPAVGWLVAAGAGYADGVAGVGLARLDVEVLQPLWLTAQGRGLLAGDSSASGDLTVGLDVRRRTVDSCMTWTPHYETEYASPFKHTRVDLVPFAGVHVARSLLLPEVGLILRSASSPPGSDHLAGWELRAAGLVDGSEVGVWLTASVFFSPPWAWRSWALTYGVDSLWLREDRSIALFVGLTSR